MNLHALAEARSLAYHREVARRLCDNPEIIQAARARVATLLARTDMDTTYARAWQQALSSSLDELVDCMTDPSERGRALRQATPFAGVLSPSERWRLWDDVRRAYLP